MQKEELIDNLALTGKYLHQHAVGSPSCEDLLSDLNTQFFDHFESVIKEDQIYNAWFTEGSIRKALGAIADSLKKQSVERWISAYPAIPVIKGGEKIIGVVMAGNIPLVGFHDLISVLVSGHHFLGKTSSKDERLIKKVAEVMTAINPDFGKRISFTDGHLGKTDAIIATGSDNTSRYFEYYFKDIPHIIRKNRNGVAVIGGNESDDQMLNLGEDIFSYFGLGCRNVTKLYIPENFDLVSLLRLFEKFLPLRDHHKYANNLDYNRTVYMMNQIPFLDNGAVLLREQKEIPSPVGVVYYEKYSQLESVIHELGKQKEEIQCIVTTLEGFKGSVQPGKSQSPELWDYADGIDTMNFLASLNKRNDL